MATIKRQQSSEIVLTAEQVGKIVLNYMIKNHNVPKNAKFEHKAYYNDYSDYNYKSRYSGMAIKYSEGSNEEIALDIGE